MRFVLAVLATWRLTHLLASEDGPADIIVRFRTWLGQSVTGELMDCFNCLSLWIAAPAALFVSRTPLEWMFCWLAVSGAACLLDRLGRPPVMISSAEGDSNDVLRSETLDAAEQSGAGNQYSGSSDPSSIRDAVFCGDPVHRQLPAPGARTCHRTPV